MAKSSTSPRTTGDDPQPGAASRSLSDEARVIVRTGKAMLNAGTGSYRVRASMEKVAACLGIDRFESHVTLSEVTVTLFQGRKFRTQVGQVHSLGVNAAKINALEEMVSNLRGGVTPEQIDDMLDAIDARPHLFNTFLNALWGAVACAAFAFLNNGGAIEVAGVFVAAWMGQFLRVNLLRRHLNQFVAAMLAGALASGAYVGLMTAMSVLTDVPARHEAGYVAAVLFLVPGFPLVTAALDLAKLDFTAGLSRFTYALMILLSAAIGLVAVTWVGNLNPSALQPLALPLAGLWFLRALASFFGVFGFALMFNTPPQSALLAACIGTVANLVRLFLNDQGVRPEASITLAALIIGLLAVVPPARLRPAGIVLSVPATLIMVPGAAAYRSLVYLIQGQSDLMLQNLTLASFSIIGIAVGLACARMLTDREWAFDKRLPLRA